MTSDFDAPLIRAIEKDILLIQVETKDPFGRVRATVYPHNLRSNEMEARATVVWDGIEAMASLVLVDADTEPWARRLCVAWAVVCPDTAPVTGQFDASNWLSLWLSLPYVEGKNEARALVSVERRAWTASLEYAGEYVVRAKIVVPEGLRKLDAGTVLVEMGSRLLLGRPFR